MNKRITTALAATMVCALTLGLAGCEGQVPQTVAPSVKDNEIIDVTVAQEKQIRGKILDVLNQANEAKKRRRARRARVRLATGDPHRPIEHCAIHAAGCHAVGDYPQ